MLFVEMFTLNRTWTDLTDSEFFWEPLPGCWSVRRRSECLTATPFGNGDWVADLTRTSLGEPLVASPQNP
jgi:hypothetical protein